MQHLILILVLALGGLAQTLNFTPILKVAGAGVYVLRERRKKRYEDDRKQIEAPPDSLPHNRSCDESDVITSSVNPMKM